MDKRLRDTEDGAPKAGPNDFSRTGLARALRTHFRNKAIVGVWDEIEAAVERGEKSGEVLVAGEKVPWRLLRQRRGGPLNGGEFLPHVPISALEAFAKLLDETARVKNRR